MEAATKTRAEEVTFISRASDQCITVRSGSEPLRNSRGETTEKGDPGFYPRFENGHLTTDMLRTQAKNSGAEDVEAAAQLAIDTIRELDQYNVTATNGIWEQGRSPAEPKPTVDERNAAIAKATATGDVDALEQIRADEQATHNRVVVLRAVQHSLDAISGGEAA